MIGALSCFNISILNKNERENIQTNKKLGKNTGLDPSPSGRILILSFTNQKVQTF